jgi:hypothetical protein
MLKQVDNNKKHRPSNLGARFDNSYIGTPLGLTGKSKAELHIGLQVIATKAESKIQWTDCLFRVSRLQPISNYRPPIVL